MGETRNETRRKIPGGVNSQTSRIKGRKKENPRENLYRQGNKQEASKRGTGVMPQN